MMPALFSPFAWLMGSTLVIWMGAALLIRFDFYRMSRERQQGNAPSWYTRPLLWFAAAAITLGLALATGTTIAYFSLSLRVYFIIMLWVLLFLLFLAGGLIIVLERPGTTREPSAPAAPAKPAAGPVPKSSAIGNISITAMGIYALTIGIYWLLLFFQGRPLLLLLVSAPVLISLIIRGCFVGYASRRLNRRRNAQASTGQRPVLDERLWSGEIQTTASEPLQSLTPPLALRLQWPVIGGYLLLSVLFTLTLPLYPHLNAVLYIISIISFCNFVIPLLRGWQESVEAMSQGLTIQQGVLFFLRKETLPWSEARLFACYKTRGFFGGRATMTYELSSARQTIRWTRVLNERSLFSPWKVELSAEEYARQIEVLCARISEQTRLPLFDLSQGRPQARWHDELLVQARMHE